MKPLVIFLMLLASFFSYGQGVKKWNKKVKKSRITITKAALRYSFSEDKASKIAEFMAEQPESTVLIDEKLSLQAQQILGYWISRKFSATLNWYLDRNHQPVGYYNLLNEHMLNELKDYEILNEVNYPKYLYQSCDTLPHYLMSAPSNYKKIGTAYAKVRYDNVKDDPLMMYPDYGDFDVWLILFK